MKNVYLRCILIFATSLLLGCSIYFWEFGYTSDRALIGLIATKILQFNEHPIFIYKAGYQGILLEEHLVALLFKVFGTSPRALELAAELLFLPLLYFFYLSVKAFHDETIALLACILLVVGSPDVHYNLLRTQPNYTETFWYGFTMFWCYSNILRDRRTLANCALIGFLCGWGLYTYQQIGYFIAALGVHLGILLLWSVRKQNSLRRGADLARFIITPWLTTRRWRVAILQAVISSFAVTLFLAGFISFWLGSTIHLGGHALTWDSVTMIRDSGLIIAAMLVLRWLSGNWKTFTPRVYLGTTVFGAAAFLGFSPALYYKWVLRLPTPVQSGIGGGWESVGYHFRIFLKGLLIFFNVIIFPSGPFYPFRIVVAMVAFSTLIYFIIIYSNKTRAFIFRGEELSESVAVSPYFLLLIVIPVIFSVSNMVTDVWRMRYAEPIIASLGVAQAFFFVEMLRKRQLVVPLRALLFSSIILIVGNNTFALARVFFDPEITAYQTIISFFDIEKVDRAYGSYWLAYSTTFLTNERILIEPTVNNWIPHYAESVAAQSRIGFADNERLFPEDQQVLTLYGNKYKVVKRYQYIDVRMAILEKIL